MDVWTRLEGLSPIVHPSQARAAVLVPLYEDEAGDVRIVLTKRPDEMRTHPGDVVFPGGTLEDGEDPVAAAIREAWEEIAIPPEAVSVIGGLTPRGIRVSNDLIVPVVARIERPAELIPDPAEVEAIIEPKVTDLLDEERWTSADFIGRPLWFYEFPEGTLWGATAFMVRELLDFLR